MMVPQWLVQPQLLQKFFEWPDDIENQVIIETKVSSATMSKRLRKEEMVALMDKMPEVYQMMYQLSEMDHKMKVQNLV